MSQGILEIFEEVAKRWTAKGLTGLIPNGVYAGEAPEQTPLPHVVLSPAVESPVQISNANVYYKISFDILLFTVTFEENTKVLPQVVDAFKYYDLPLTNDKLLSLYEKPKRYTFLKREQYWRGVATMEALVARATDFNPK